MKRLPPTPQNADSATLRWIAKLLDTERDNARAEKAAVPESALWGAQMDARAKLAIDVAAWLRERATRLEGKRKRSGRAGR